MVQVPSEKNEGDAQVLEASVKSPAKTPNDVALQIAEKYTDNKIMLKIAFMLWVVGKKLLLFVYVDTARVGWHMSPR